MANKKIISLGFSFFARCEVLPESGPFKRFTAPFKTLLQFLRIQTQHLLLLLRLMDLKISFNATYSLAISRHKKVM